MKNIGINFSLLEIDADAHSQSYVEVLRIGRFSLVYVEWNVKDGFELDMVILFGVRLMSWK